MSDAPTSASPKEASWVLPTIIVATLLAIAGLAVGVFSMLKETDAAATNGANGAKGPPGAPGKPGTNGSTGPPGLSASLQAQVLSFGFILPTQDISGWPASNPPPIGADLFSVGATFLNSDGKIYLPNGTPGRICPLTCKVGGTYIFSARVFSQNLGAIFYIVSEPKTPTLLSRWNQFIMGGSCGAVNNTVIQATLNNPNFHLDVGDIVYCIQAYTSNGAFSRANCVFTAVLIVPD